MMVLKCNRCGSTDLDKSNEANDEQAYCNGCNGLMDIDMECDLIEKAKSEEEYVSSLENLLIFMCQTYEEIEQVLFKLANEGNEALFKVPRIQGTVNTIPIAQLAKMTFVTPKYGFKTIKEEILKKQS